MTQERTEVVVLRGVDFSESSRIVTFLCPDRGRLSCMAKGVKRPKSQLAALLDTFNRLEIVYYWKDSRSVQQLAEGSLLDGYPNVKRDLEKTTFGAFPLEVAYRAAHDNEPSSALYDRLVHGLESLDAWSGDARTHCCWQVLGLLATAGFAPALDRCYACGKEVAASPGFAYAGGVACAKCPRDRTLKQETIASLRLLAEKSEECPRAAATAEAYDAVRWYATQQMESEFRSARVIEQMFS